MFPPIIVKMKVLDIFTTLLIFGIWNPTISQALSPSTNELIRKMEELRNTSDGTNMNLYEAIERFAENCERNSGPMAVENLAKSVYDEYFNCMQSKFDALQFKDLTINAQLNGEWKTVFTKYCAKLPALTECLDCLTVPMKSCVDPEERNNVDIVRGILRLIVEFGCHDGGDLVASFVKFGGVECWQSQEARVQSCAYSSYRAKNFSGNVLGAAFPNLANLSLSLNLGQEECTGIEDFRNCTVEVFKDCDNPEAARVLDSMFISYERFTPCRNITESSSLVSKGLLADISISNISIGEQVSSGMESEKYESLLKRRCDKNAGPGAYETVQENYQLVLNSSNLLIPSLQFRDALVAAQSIEDLYTVFKKYCRRAPILHELYRYFVDSINSCLELEEQRTVDVIYNSLTVVQDFICYNEGRRTATFLADQGFVCLIFNFDGILRCADQNLDLYNQTARLSTPGCCDTLPVLGSEFCTDMNKFHVCSVEVLAEQCKDQTTSNLVDLVLTSISNKIQCGNSSEAQIPAVIEISSPNPAPKSNESERISSESDSDVQFTIGLVDPDSTNVTSEDVSNYISIKCEKNGGPITFGSAKNLSHYRSDGFEPLTVDLRQLGYNIAEIQRANSYNTLMIAFTKYCRTVPTIERRIQYLTESMKPCLDSQERTKVDVIRNATSSMLEFGCENKGNNEFSGDAECWAKTLEAVGNCFNQPSASDHPIDDCTKDLREFQRCIVNAMKECQDPTPGTIMDSLLDHVIQRISCE